MDLRIVNTCNNNCLYCLESNLRDKVKYISTSNIFSDIDKGLFKNHITFYGGNPILHPDLLSIIGYCKKSGFKSIGLFTNTSGITKKSINLLMEEGLSDIGIYFNSFDKNNHEIVNGGGISYEDYLNNLSVLYNSGINVKVIIHINKINIKSVARDILILRKKYGFNSFDFVNYFPFDRPYENKSLLEYDILEYKNEIALLFKVVIINNINVNFMKFSKDFFGKNQEFYNFKRGVLEQIGKEDEERLSGTKVPFCLDENRCDKCFIKDNCKFYVI